MLITGQFSDKNAGQNKVVNIQGIQLGGADASNYKLLVDTAQTQADIERFQLQTVAGIRAIPKLYNASTSVYLDLSAAKLPEIFAGDDVYLSQAIGTMERAGPGRNLRVDISDLGLSGADASNYEFSNGSWQTAVDVTLVESTEYRRNTQFSRSNSRPVNQFEVVLNIDEGVVNREGLNELKY